MASAAIFDRYVRTFRESGFGGGLAYYRNIDDNWRHDLPFAEQTIECPSRVITGRDDPVIEFMRAESGSAMFTKLRITVIDGAGHWVHQEKPVEVISGASQRRPIVLVGCSGAREASELRFQSLQNVTPKRRTPGWDTSRQKKKGATD